MKTNGALFLTALQNEPRLTSCQLAHDALPQWAKDAYDRAAAAYDQARVALPDDVEAFVVECEKHAKAATGAYGFTRLCSIVREQGARIAGLTEDNSRLQQIANDCQKERDEHWERVAKLESYAATQREKRLLTKESAKCDKRDDNKRIAALDKLLTVLSTFREDVHSADVNYGAEFAVEFRASVVEALSRSTKRIKLGTGE